VAGAGGFIGGHLVVELLRRGYTVRAVDRKPISEWYQVQDGADNRVADLSLLDQCEIACDGMDWVFNLAADMGGMGFIESNKALCMLSSLITTHLLLASQRAGVQRFFYASSACVYASWHQDSPDVTPLRESDAYPADPEDGYGWEKLFGERMCRHFTEDFGMETRVARFHNVYGPFGTWTGGREKAPAAASRKVAEFAAEVTDEVEIWGDGLQARSFTYIDDCIEGTLRLMESDFREPLNIGSAETVTIADLYALTERIAGLEEVPHRYISDAPQGVRGRSSDNTLCKSVLGWEPRVSLEDGMRATYDWVAAQLVRVSS
jgi:nucleoside-diphosphate-sugar epimerase